MEIASIIIKELDLELLNYDRKILPVMVHDKIKCNECEINPIVGTWYECVTCETYNLCSKCEEETKHPHNFIKVKSAEQIVRPAAPC